VTFDETGVYPFACNYHPGMTGAIVVGDGKGAGGDDITVEALEPAPKVVAAEPDGMPGGVVAAMALIGLAIGAGLALGVGRLGRTRPAP
jgi:hypothetical protein